MSPERYIHDSLTLMDFMQIGENADTQPLGLVGGGEHFADINGGQCKASRLGRRRIAFNDINPQRTTCLRTTMLQHVITLDIHRPCRFHTYIIFKLFIVFQFNYHHPICRHFPVQFPQNVA